MKKLMAILLAMIVVLSCAGTAMAEEKVTLNLWHRWSGANEAILTQCVENFEAANPGYDIEITGKAGEYFELLQSMIADAAAGNDMPDIFVGGYNLLNYIAEELGPVEVETLAKAAEADVANLYANFTPEMLALAAYDGKQIGLPLAVSNMIMYLNWDIFEAAGLTEEDIPTTWDEVMEVSKIITEKTEADAIYIQLPDNWGDMNLVGSAGGSLLSEDKTRVSFTNEGCINALTTWQKLYTEGYAFQGTDTEATANFSAGTIAMNCTTIMKINNYLEHGTFNLKTAQLPAFEGQGKKLIAGGAAMISFSEDEAKQAGVYKFLEYMSSQEGMELFTDTGYLNVTVHEVTVVPGQEPAYAQTPYASPWECWPGGSIGLEIDGMWLNARNSIMWDGADVVETLTALEEECNMMLENA